MLLAEVAPAGSPRPRPRPLQRDGYGGRVGSWFLRPQAGRGAGDCRTANSIARRLSSEAWSGSRVAEVQRVVPQTAWERKPRLPEAPPLRRPLLGGRKAPAQCGRCAGARGGRCPAPRGSGNRPSRQRLDAQRLGLGILCSEDAWRGRSSGIGRLRKSHCRKQPTSGAWIYLTKGFQIFFFFFYRGMEVPKVLNLI